MLFGHVLWAISQSNFSTILRIPNMIETATAAWISAPGEGSIPQTQLVLCEVWTPAPHKGLLPTICFP